MFKIICRRSENVSICTFTLIKVKDAANYNFRMIKVWSCYEVSKKPSFANIWKVEEKLTMKMLYKAMSVESPSKQFIFWVIDIIKKFCNKYIFISNLLSFMLEFYKLDQLDISNNKIDSSKNQSLTSKNGLQKVLIAVKIWEWKKIYILLVNSQYLCCLHIEKYIWR